MSEKMNQSHEQTRKITRFNIVFINIQLVLTFLTIGLFIWYIIDNSILYLFQFFLGITLLVMAYNNHIIYRRRLATIGYSIIGVMLLVLDFIMYFMNGV